MAKWIACLLAVCMMSAAGCVRNTDPEDIGYEETLAAYADAEGTMFIGAHGAPAATVEAYEQAREMGLTHIFTTDYGEDVLAAANASGIKLIAGMGNTLNTEHPFADWSTDFSEDKYRSVEMIDYFDEPYGSHFDTIAMWVDRHNEKYASSGGADPLFWVNLQPMDMHMEDYPRSDDGYIADYCQKVLSKIQGDKILSFDLYAIRQLWRRDTETGTLVPENYIAEEWLRSLELVGRYGEQYGARTHAYLQTCGFYKPYENGWTCRRATEEDLRMQAYVSMAFGVRNFSHFTYSTSGDLMNSHGYTQACIDLNGKPTDLYYGAKSVNEELLALDPYLSCFTRTGTKTYAADGAVPAFDMLQYTADSLSALTDVSCTADTVIGQYRDEIRGKDALIIANYTETTDVTADSVTLTLSDGARGLAVFRRGEWSQARAVNGKVTVDLAPGDGVFAVILK